jgi:hypothetical protein
MSNEVITRVHLLSAGIKYSPVSHTPFILYYSLNIIIILRRMGEVKNTHVSWFGKLEGGDSSSELFLDERMMLTSVIGKWDLRM